MRFTVNAVIFDFDGVIIDSGADIANAVQDTLKIFNRPVLPKSEIISYVGHGAEYLIKRSFKDCSPEVIGRAIPFYKKYYLEHSLIETSLYPQVQETLAAIKAQESNKVALVTNKPEDISEKILRGLGVRQYFDVIVGPESVKKLKPDPEGIRKALTIFGVSAEKAVMVGDTYVDILAGKSAGTYTCGVTYGLGDKKELVKSAPDFLINDMGQLLQCIDFNR